MTIKHRLPLFPRRISQPDLCCLLAFPPHSTHHSHTRLSHANCAPDAVPSMRPSSSAPTAKLYTSGLYIYPRKIYPATYMPSCPLCTPPSLVPEQFLIQHSFSLLAPTSSFGFSTPRSRPAVRCWPRICSHRPWPLFPGITQHCGDMVRLLHGARRSRVGEKKVGECG
ncbi:hypothetical protein BC567DRAFT_222728 [Phyllosticta citribraziliensis]